jgi:hypothetical protein
LIKYLRSKHWEIAALQNFRAWFGAQQKEADTTHCVAFSTHVQGSSLELFERLEEDSDECSDVGSRYLGRDLQQADESKHAK